MPISRPQLFPQFLGQGWEVAPAKTRCKRPNQSLGGGTETQTIARIHLSRPGVVAMSAEQPGEGTGHRRGAMHPRSAPHPHSELLGTMISLDPRPADFDQVAHRRQEAWLLGNAQKDRLLQSGAKHLPFRVVAHETPHIVPLPYLGQLPVVVLAVPEGDQ